MTVHVLVSSRRAVDKSANYTEIVVFPGHNHLLSEGLMRREQFSKGLLDHYALSLLKAPITAKVVCFVV